MQRRFLAIILIDVFLLLWLRRRRRQRALSADERNPTSSEQGLDRDRRAFTAFLSHYKVEAATEARWLQEKLEPLLGGRPFLDSDGMLHPCVPSQPMLSAQVSVTGDTPRYRLAGS